MTRRFPIYDRDYVDLELLEKYGITFVLTRYYCDVIFEMEDGWSEIYRGILDIGSPASTISEEIWNNCSTEIIVEEYQIGGLVHKEECKLNVKIGEMSCRLVGEGSVSNKIDIRAFLSSEESPALITWC